MSTVACPFCSLPKERAWLESSCALVFADGFPLSTGHTLVIPKTHVASLFELPEVQLSEIWSQVAKVRALLQDLHHPDGFNIGLNDGAAAGQTVPHAHIHVIPRFTGDVLDPRGGVRWIIPSKARYW